MSSVTIILALSTLSFILYQVNANDVSRTWCPQTGLNDLCIKIVDTDPRNDMKTSPEGLARLIADRAMMLLISNMLKVNDLIKTSSGTYNHMLRQCYDDYDMGHYHLQHANFTVMDRNSYPDLAGHVGFPIEATDNCEAQFSESTPSPLTRENKLLADIALVALRIVNMKVCGRKEACIP